MRSRIPLLVSTSAAPLSFSAPARNAAPRSIASAEPNCMRVWKPPRNNHRLFSKNDKSCPRGSFWILNTLSFPTYELILNICFAIESECFARRGSKGSLPVHVPSRAGYCGAKPVPQGASFARSDSGQELRPHTHRLPYGSYSDSFALATLTFSADHCITNLYFFCFLK